jgi:hypothetical protein
VETAETDSLGSPWCLVEAHLGPEWPIALLHQARGVPQALQIATVDRKALADLPAPVRGRVGILATTSMADQEIVLVRSGPALTPDPF